MSFISDMNGRPMLGVNKYPKDYVDAARAAVQGQVASYRALAAAARDPAGVADFERRFFSHMLLALDSYFVHRLRGVEGKDGSALNEVRMLANGVMSNAGMLAAARRSSTAPKSRSPGSRIRDR